MRARARPGTSRPTSSRRRPRRAPQPVAKLVASRPALAQPVLMVELPRSAGGPDGGRRQRPVPGPRPRPGGPAGRLSGRPRRHRAVLPAAGRGGRAVRRGDQAEPRLLRVIRLGRDRRPRADPGEGPRRHPGRRRREAGRHRLDGAAPGRRPLRPPRGRRDHRQSVRRRRGPASRSSSAATAIRTSCAEPPTRARTSSRACQLAASRRRDRRRPAEEPLHDGSPGASRRWGPGGTVGLVVGATAPERAGPDPGDRTGPRLPRAGRRRPGRRRRRRIVVQGRRRRLRRRPAGRRAAGQRLPGHRPAPSTKAGPPGEPADRSASGSPQAARNWSTTLAVPVLSYGLDADPQATLIRIDQRRSVVDSGRCSEVN